MNLVWSCRNHLGSVLGSDSSELFFFVLFLLALLNIAASLLNCASRVVLLCFHQLLIMYSVHAALKKTRGSKKPLSPVNGGSCGGGVVLTLLNYFWNVPVGALGLENERNNLRRACYSDVCD